MHCPRHGFTLIELMIAVSLSSVIILLATAAFSAASSALGELETLAARNRGLRIAYRAVAEEADYWHHHANPGFPYLRRHQSLREADREDTRDHVRPFAPVQWSAVVGDPGNPAAWPAHDSRSWYRNHLRQNRLSGIRRYSYARFGNVPDFLHPIAQSDIPAVTQLSGNDVNNKTGFGKDAISRRAVVPVGWEPWNLTGDYAAISNLDGRYWRHDPASSGDDGAIAPLPNADVTAARHRQIFNAFAQLGVYGLLDYTPAGSLNLVQLSSLNQRTAAYIGTPDEKSQYDILKGEFPFTTIGNGEVFGSGRFDLDNVNGTARLHHDLGTAIPGFNVAIAGRWNIAAGTPSTFHHERGTLNLYRQYQLLADHRSFFGLVPATMPTYANRNDKTGGSYGSIQREWVGLVFPQAPLSTSYLSNNFDWLRYQRLIVDPLHVLTVKPTNTWLIAGEQQDQSTQFRFFPQTHSQVIQQQLLGETWLVPVSRSDDETAPGDGFAPGGVRVGVQMHRWRTTGLDRLEATLVIDDGARSERMPLSLLGTNFRGARMYWGRRSSASASERPRDPTGAVVEIGDLY